MQPLIKPFALLVFSYLMAHRLSLVALLFFIAFKSILGSRFVEGGNGLQVELTSHWENNKSFEERVSSLVAWSNARSEMHAMRLGRGHKKHHGGYESPLVPDGDLYWMEIAVGTPLQRFMAIADTGSDLVWLKIDVCQGCNETTFSTNLSTTYKPIPCSGTACRDAFYDAQGASRSFCFPNSLSSSELSRQCGFLYRYGSGVTSGYAGTDVVSLTSTKKKKKRSVHRAFPDVLIGGGTAYAGFGDASGLVGLGQGPLSLTTQLGSAIRHKFSYCLVTRGDSTKSSPLLFGEAAELKGHGITSIPILPHSTYYLLDLQGVNVSGEFVTPDIPQYTVIDSGTVLTHLDEQTYSRVYSVFNSSVALPKYPEELAAWIGLQLCYNMTGHKDYEFPSFSLVFRGGATWNLAPANYMIISDDTACLGLISQSGGVNIIGNLMQRNFHILYDRNESMLSFVPAECGKT